MSSLKKWGVLIGAGLSAMLIAIDITVVNTSLVAIQKSLSASLADLQWYISAFGIPFCVLLVIGGRLADLLGRRLILYIGMAGFGLASLAAGFSTSSWELITCRFFQGVFGAAIFPSGMALTADAFSKKERGRAFGIFFGLLGAGLAIGPALGGFITSFFGWNWIFFINIPVLLLSFLICIPTIPRSRSLEKQQIDWKGLCLILIGLSALVTWITEGPYLGWKSPLSLIILAIALVFLWLFYRSEKSTSSSILPIAFFKKRSFAIATISNIACTSCMWGVIFIVPIYLQAVLNYTPYAAGLILLVLTVMTMIIPPIAGRILDKQGMKTIIWLNFAVLIAGYLCVLLFSATGTLWHLFVALILLGFGWGSGNAISGPIVLSGQHSSTNAGLLTGAATTVLNVFGVLIATQTGTSFRFAEKMRLYELLRKENVLLTPKQEESIFQVLAEPETLNNVLAEFSHEKAKQIFAFFKNSFTFGFQAALLFLLLLTLILLVLMFLTLKRKARS